MSSMTKALIELDKWTQANAERIMGEHPELLEALDDLEDFLDEEEKVICVLCNHIRYLEATGELARAEDPEG